MGGNAFDNRDPPLATPRLSPEEYREVRYKLVERLREHFNRVAVPIDGPAKTSYGDVDIIVSEPRLEDLERSHSVSPSVITRILQSTARNGSSYAVLKAPLLQDRQDVEPDTYVQVDVSVLHPDKFDWHYFMHCHGDIWNMLSPSLRRVGLVMTDAGLCLMNPTIAPMDRKRSRLPLSNDPDTVLQYLGFDTARFWGKDPMQRNAGPDGTTPEFFGEADGPLGGRSFASEAEHFAFVASSRFFDKKAYQTDDLKSQDRRRTGRRDAYGRFVHSFVPTVDNHVASLTYDGTIDEALTYFGRKKEYDEKDRIWREEQDALEDKRVQRAARKYIAEQDIQYADAWMGHLA